MHPATRLKALQQVHQQTAAAAAVAVASAFGTTATGGATSRKSSGAGKSKAAGAGGSASTDGAPTGPPKPVFECTVCGKGLARKDKLTIHMRIHTGEKPYVCEVCDRAFARRDKLVIHMNKFKHVTPTNIAPLGKRQNRTPSLGLDLG